eukprot:1072304-Prymnesium_polylepis.2
MVDAPQSDAELRRRYLVPYVPVAAQRPRRASNLGVTRWQPGADALALAAHDSRSRVQIVCPSSRHGSRFLCVSMPSHSSHPVCPPRRLAEGDWMERRQAAAAARRTGGGRSTIVRQARAPRPDPEVLRLPKEWFVYELYTQLRRAREASLEDAAQASGAAHAAAAGSLRAADGAGQGRGDAGLRARGGRARQADAADVVGGHIQVRHRKAHGDGQNLLPAAGGCSLRLSRKVDLIFSNS